MLACQHTHTLVHACLLVHILGSFPNTTHANDQIKAMPWFADIDWDALLRMEVEPPFKPAVKGDDDVSAVDDVFLVEPAAISATPAGAAPIAGGEEFKGFTFVVGGEVLSVTEGTVLE